MEKCPNCGAKEIEANTPRTVYKCGSSDYDQRPGTFKTGKDCVLIGDGSGKALPEIQQ